MGDLNQWLESGEYLPELLRDFHDQKEIFKGMHSLYSHQARAEIPNWANGQIYTIDWFLWYMASRGYTLQKSRKNVEFKDLYKPPKNDTLVDEFLKKKEAPNDK